MHRTPPSPTLTDKIAYTSPRFSQHLSTNDELLPRSGFHDKIIKLNDNVIIEAIKEKEHKPALDLLNELQTSIEVPLLGTQK
jgi:hypothetical protein